MVSVQFHINDIEREDFGEYECVASNAIGTVSRSIKIIEGKKN
jgi:hypothetical protein